MQQKDVPIGLAQARRRLRERLLEASVRYEKASRSPLDAARAFVRILCASLPELNSALQVESERGAVIAQSVVQSAALAYLQCLHGHEGKAADTVYRIWREHVASLVEELSPAESTDAYAPRRGDGGPTSMVAEAATIAYEVRGQEVHPMAPAPLASRDKQPNGNKRERLDREFLVAFNCAVGEYLRLLDIAEEGRHILRQLMVVLDLSHDDLSQMFRVADETVRRWERGIAPISAKRFAALTSVEGAMRRLLELFRPDRLAVAVRRPAELFDHERALDWILRGRITEVADRYERALSYQG